MGIGIDRVNDIAELQYLLAGIVPPQFTDLLNVLDELLTKATPNATGPVLVVASSPRARFVIPVRGSPFA